MTGSQYDLASLICRLGYLHTSPPLDASPEQVMLSL